MITSQNVTAPKQLARTYPIDYVEFSTWGKVPGTDEIVKMLGGGDKTTGSCSSLAFAYFGNKGGNMIRDFRGGVSCDFFATSLHIKQVVGIDGVASRTWLDKNAFKAAEAAIDHVEAGKRYYFCVGRHAAVVEKRDDLVYYLELQTEDENGWHLLDKKALKGRFECTKTKSLGGAVAEQEAILIDGSTLSGNAEFTELMGYINTLESEQQKGVGGRAK